MFLFNLTQQTQIIRQLMFDCLSILNYTLSLVRCRIVTSYNQSMLFCLPIGKMTVITADMT